MAPTKLVRAGMLRRLRYWHRTTPNARMASNLLGASCLVALVIGVLAGVDTHWL